MNDLFFAIQPDVALHTIIPLIAFLGLRHLGIAVFIIVLHRARRSDGVIQQSYLASVPETGCHTQFERAALSPTHPMPRTSALRTLYHNSLSILISETKAADPSILLHRGPLIDRLWLASSGPVHRARLAGRSSLRTMLALTSTLDPSVGTDQHARHKIVSETNHDLPASPNQIGQERAFAR